MKQFNEIFKEVVNKQIEDYSIISRWQNIFNLNHIEIRTEEIHRSQVTFPDDISKEEKYFVGIRLEDNIATIYHDRDLTEEDIVHELLHLANPDKKEDWVNKETKIRLNETNN